MRSSWKGKSSRWFARCWFYKGKDSGRHPGRPGEQRWDEHSPRCMAGSVRHTPRCLPSAWGRAWLGETSPGRTGAAPACLPPCCPTAVPLPGQPGELGSHLVTLQALGFSRESLASPTGRQVPAGQRSCGLPSFPSLGPVAATFAQVPEGHEEWGRAPEPVPRVPLPYGPPHHGCHSLQGDPRLKGSFTWPGLSPGACGCTE